MNTNKNSSTFRSKNLRNENSKPVYKSFCKVCQDAGKLESEYTSHNVKDRKNGHITCPTLLALECRNCFHNGHTVKYCPLLKAQSEPVKKQYVKPVISASKPKNVFMILDDSDSEEEKEKEKTNVNDQFPALKSAATAKPVLNYSKLISITEEQVKREAITALLKEEKKALEVKAPVKITVQEPKKKFSWVDAESDSEGDDEEEEEEGGAW
jgi:hypothetical protein